MRLKTHCASLLVWTALHSHLTAAVFAADPRYRRRDYAGGTAAAMDFEKRGGNWGVLAARQVVSNCDTCEPCFSWEDGDGNRIFSCTLPITAIIMVTQWKTSWIRPTRTVTSVVRPTLTQWTTVTSWTTMPASSSAEPVNRKRQAVIFTETQTTSMTTEPITITTTITPASGTPVMVTATSTIWSTVSAGNSQLPGNANSTAGKVSSGRRNIGPIVGGIIGGLAALFFIVAVVFCMRRQKKQHGEKPGGLGTKRSVMTESSGHLVPPISVEVTPLGPPPRMYDPADASRDTSPRTSDASLLPRSTSPSHLHSPASPAALHLVHKRAVSASVLGPRPSLALTPVSPRLSLDGNVLFSVSPVSPIEQTGPPRRRSTSNPPRPPKAGVANGASTVGPPASNSYTVPRKPVPVSGTMPGQAM